MEKAATVKQQSVVKVIANLFQRFLNVLVRFLFKYVIYGKKGQSMPPIRNLLLLESASSLAIKIRTRKVCKLAKIFRKILIKFFSSIDYVG